MANTTDKNGMIIDVQPLRTSEAINDFRESLSLAGKDSAQKERNLLLFNLGINTGLRIGDIVKLRIEDVKGRSHVVIQEGKTKKRRKVYLNAIMADISDYLDGKPSEGWLFPSRKGNGHITTTQAYRILNKAAELSGRNDIGTHTLRKTFGYHYYRKTKDIATLMAIFNHSSQSVTKRYIGITDDEIENSLRDFSL